MSTSGKNTAWTNPALCQRAVDMLRGGYQISAISMALSSEFREHLTYRMVYAWVERHHPEFISRRTMQPIRRPVFDPLPPAGPRANKLHTVFIRKRKEISPELGRHNADVLRSVARRVEHAGSIIATDLRYQAALWANCETSFAAYDVEAANPLTAAADARPYNWGADRRPSLVLGVSALGAAAGSM